MQRRAALFGFLGSIIFMAGCTPTVQVAAPEKPIEINLNVKIEHHIKVEMEKDIRSSMAKNPDIF
jgi:hypothetical protein